MDKEERWDNYITERLDIETGNFRNLSELALLFAVFLKENRVSKLLDLGCGLGRHMHYFTHKGFKVIGCDISEKTLVAAEKLAIDQGLKMDFIRGDYIDLPFYNSIFPAVLAISTIHHDFPESIYRGLKEIHRVMTPGGFFAFDPLSTGDGWFGNGRALGDKLFLIHKIPHYFFDRKELETLLERLYFEILSLSITRYPLPESEGEGNQFREKFHIIVKKIQPKKLYGPPIRRPLL